MERYLPDSEHSQHSDEVGVSGFLETRNKSKKGSGKENVASVSSELKGFVKRSKLPTNTVVQESSSTGVKKKYCTLSPSSSSREHNTKKPRLDDSFNPFDTPSFDKHSAPSSMRLSVTSPDLFDDVPLERESRHCHGRHSGNHSHHHRHKSPRSTVADVVGLSDSDDDVQYTGELKHSKLKRQSHASSSNPKKSSKSSKNHHLRNVNHEHQVGHLDRPPLQKSPRCQLFPTRDRHVTVTPRTSSASVVAPSSSGSTLDQDFDRVNWSASGTTGSPNKYRQYSSSRRATSRVHQPHNHSKRYGPSTNTLSGTSSHHIPSPSRHISRSRQSRSTSRAYFDPEIFDAELSDEEVSATVRPTNRRSRSAESSLSFRPSDPIALVQQVEDDERLAQSLQAQYDAEATRRRHHRRRRSWQRQLFGSNSPTEQRRPRWRSAVAGSPIGTRSRTHLLSPYPRQTVIASPFDFDVDLMLDNEVYEPYHVNFFAVQSDDDVAEDLLGTVHEMISMMDEGLTGFESRLPRNRRRRLEDVRLDDYEFLLDIADTIGPATRTGMTNAEIGRLPTCLYAAGGCNASATNSERTPGTECHICMNDYEANDRLRILTCFHDFHARCIDRWLKDNNTCPLCRATVNVAQ